MRGMEVRPNLKKPEILVTQLDDGAVAIYGLAAALTQEGFYAQLDSYLPPKDGEPYQDAPNDIPSGFTIEWDATKPYSKVPENAVHPAMMGLLVIRR